MKFGLTYLPYAADGHSVAEMFHRNVEQIEFAESCGFDVAFMSEHHFLANDMLPSPLIALSYIAAKTTKIRLGTGLILLPLHDPVAMAEHAMVLDLISGGRLVFGIGQGYRPEEFKGFGRRLEDRQGLMREGAQLIRKLWTESDVTFRGKHFQVEGLTVTPKPAQKPAPPIWVGAKKRRAVELAAEIGDGWYPDPITPLPIIKKNKEHWLTALQKHGKDRRQQTLAYYREFFVGPDDESAWKTGGVGVMGEYRFYLSVNHLVDDGGHPISSDRDDLVEGLVRERCTIGSPEHCRAHLEMINEALAPEYVILKMGHPGTSHDQVMASMRLAAEQVIPRM